MSMKLVGDDWIEFESTGLERYCYDHLISIKKGGTDFKIGYGYDGILDSPRLPSQNQHEDDDHALSLEEREELARYMIGLWAEYGGMVVSLVTVSES
jgi:hypothetical protein